MATPGRWVKNPARVPRFSQEHDPVGNEPGDPDAVRVVEQTIEEEPPVYVPAGGPPVMAKIEQTGTYRDKDGNSFFFRKGHEVEAGAYELVEAANRNAGAPETRADGAEIVDARPERADKGAKPGKGE